MFLHSSGASRLTEYLSLGHSSAVWLREINVWINNKIWIPRHLSEGF
jgi:hypothetical protein